MSICRSCVSRRLVASGSRPAALMPSVRYIATTPTRSNEDEALKKARQSAWYLDPKPAAAPVQPTPRRPRFTTFDPESTQSEAEVQPITPLPDNATSPLLRQLHQHLTKGSDSVDHASVRFLHTPSSRLLQSQEGVEGSLLGESGATSWEWVIVCQVRGRGRGVINRAEKEIRKWMREELGRRTRSRTASREESDTDWSMLHVGEGVCVNLFTAEGRERWDLEKLWA